jgi:hypothetical protein
MTDAVEQVTASVLFHPDFSIALAEASIVEHAFALPYVAASLLEMVLTPPNVAAVLAPDLKSVWRTNLFSKRIGTSIMVMSIMIRKGHTMTVVITTESAESLLALDCIYDQHLLIA